MALLALSIDFGYCGRDWFGEALVERVEFMHWLTGIGRLSPAQRRQALTALGAAKEGDEGVGSGAGGSSETRVRESQASPAKVATGKGSSERRVGEDVARGAPARPRWSAGAVRIARVATSSPGDARTVWRATAARAAGARSTP